MFFRAPGLRTKHFECFYLSFNKQYIVKLCELALKKKFPKENTLNKSTANNRRQQNISLHYIIIRIRKKKRLW